MSKFLSKKYLSLRAYTPGEQPKESLDLLKLNTNESPFPPSQKSIAYAYQKQRTLNLYPDPECTELKNKIAELYQVNPDEVILTNGSDEVLNFAFMAFCDKENQAIFPDITYGFYPVFANLNGIDYVEIPLDSELKIKTEDYKNIDGTIFIANPNAPTGHILDLDEIEYILKSNLEHPVIIDEAYIDFGGKTCIPLIKKYDNLLVSHTFSKSRSFAGGRLGYGIGNKELIKDLNLIKYSTNPYNINSMTMALGLGILQDKEYYLKNCATIIENRSYLTEELVKLDFEVIPSKANFIFAKHNQMSGNPLYLRLKEKNILVRHFNIPKIKDYIRITIGTKAQMKDFLLGIKQVLEENNRENSRY